MEVWFYHLQTQPLERALPAIVEKARTRGWRVLVETVDDLRLKALDDMLWTYAPESFLPHGTTRDKDAARHPVLLSSDGADREGFELRMYVEGAEVALRSDAALHERAIVLFDGRNDEMVEAARAQWKRLKGQGFALAYWQQTEAGGWDRTA